MSLMEFYWNAIASSQGEWSGGIFKSGGAGYVTGDSRLYITRTKSVPKGCVIPFGDLVEHVPASMDVTCVEELGSVIPDLQRSPPRSCLLVGASSYCQNLMLIYSRILGRTLRSVDLGSFQISCASLIDDGTSEYTRTSDLISKMEGVVAVGCADGTVLLCDLNIRDIQFDISSFEKNNPRKLRVFDHHHSNGAVAEEQLRRCQNAGDSFAVTLIKGTEQDGITALHCPRESCSLYVGYASGLWQIWNIASCSLVYECQVEEETPIHGFSVMEPCDDPRPTLYVWITLERGLSQPMVPLVRMYCLSYEKKSNVPGYGSFFEGFLHCYLAFSMPLMKSDTCHLLSSSSISSSVKRESRYNYAISEKERLQSRLFVTAFTSSGSRTESTFLTVFDLDQWYRERMPHTTIGKVPSYLETIEVCQGRALAVHLVEKSLCLYPVDNPPDVMLVPSSLSYTVRCLTDKGPIEFSKIGLQELWMRNIESLSASVLTRPTRIFEAAVSAGLAPKFGFVKSDDSASYSEEEMRTYVLLICLENALKTVLIKASDLWADGTLSVEGCTLTYLLRVLWTSVCSSLSHINSFSQIFFGATQKLDERTARELKTARYIIKHTVGVYSQILEKHRSRVFDSCFDSWLEAMKVARLAIDQLNWFLDARILPEIYSDTVKSPGVFYDYPKLKTFADSRRETFLGLSLKKKQVGGDSIVCPSTGYYLADSLLEGEDAICSKWESENGTPDYPPSTIQALLRTFTVTSASEKTKVKIAQYFLHDLISLLDKEAHESIINDAAYYWMCSGLTESEKTIIQGLWYIDHSFYKDGVDCLLSSEVRGDDVSLTQYRAVLRVLYLAGEDNLALQYHRGKHAGFTNSDDIRFELATLLSNRMTYAAYELAKKMRQESLFTMLFNGCIEKHLAIELIRLPLTTEVSDAFEKFLLTRKDRTGLHDHYLVVFYLSRSRYYDAALLNEQLKSRNRPRTELDDRREDFVQGLCSVLLPSDWERIKRGLKQPTFGLEKHPLSFYLKARTGAGMEKYFGPENTSISKSGIVAMETATIEVSDPHRDDKKRGQDWLNKGGPTKKRKVENKSEDPEAQNLLCSFLGNKGKESSISTPFRDSVHSILKPRTPRETTPRKTLRWATFDLSSAPKAQPKPIVEAPRIPEGSDENAVNWAEIAAEAAEPVLFSVDLSKKEPPTTTRSQLNVEPKKVTTDKSKKLRIADLTLFEREYSVLDDTGPAVDSTSVDLIESETTEIQLKTLKEPSPKKQDKVDEDRSQAVIRHVVSLSQPQYVEMEEDGGSGEDPEEAEIPPVIEFCHPEEGLVAESVQNEGAEDLTSTEESEDQLKEESDLDYNESFESDDQEVEEEYSETDDFVKDRRSFFHDKWNDEDSSTSSSSSSSMEKMSVKKKKEDQVIELSSEEESREPVLEAVQESELEFDEPQPEVEPEPVLEVIEPEPELKVVLELEPVPDEVIEPEPELNVIEAEPVLEVMEPEPELNVIEAEPVLGVVEPEPTLQAAEPEPEAKAIQPSSSPEVIDILKNLSKGIMLFGSPNDQESPGRDLATYQVGTPQQSLVPPISETASTTSDEKVVEKRKPSPKVETPLRKSLRIEERKLAESRKSMSVSPITTPRGRRAVSEQPGETPSRKKRASSAQPEPQPGPSQSGRHKRKLETEEGSWFSTLDLARLDRSPSPSPKEGNRVVRRARSLQGKTTKKTKTGAEVLPSILESAELEIPKPTTPKTRKRPSSVCMGDVGTRRRRSSRLLLLEAIDQMTPPRQVPEKSKSPTQRRRPAARSAFMPLYPWEEVDSPESPPQLLRERGAKSTSSTAAKKSKEPLAAVPEESEDSNLSTSSSTASAPLPRVQPPQSMTEGEVEEFVKEYSANRRLTRRSKSLLQKSLAGSASTSQKEASTAQGSSSAKQPPHSKK